MSTEAPERISRDYFPTEDEYQKLKNARATRGRWFQVFAVAMLAIAVLALVTLLLTIIGDSFGLTAVVTENAPEDVVASLGYDPETTTIEDLSFDEQVGLLVVALGEGSGVGRRLEREQRFYDDQYVFEDPLTYAVACTSDEPFPGCDLPPRDAENVTQLVYERVVVPDVIASYELFPSLFNPEAFVAEVEQSFLDDPGRFAPYVFDDVTFEWRAWLSWEFVTSPSNSTPELAGIRTAILGTAWLMIITLLFAVPVGVGAAIYLNEFAKPTRFNDFVQTNIYNLAGVPSIIYGMLGLAVFVRILEPITSGAIFTDGIPPSDNGRTILSGGLTLGLLILPVVIISAQEALKAVPMYLRTGGLALGATKWQTVRSQVLPVAFPGILTGTILAVSRAIGETAPLILVGAAGFITSDPTGPFSKFTALPIQIFQWTSLPQQEFRNIAAAASIVLLFLLLLLNGTAVLLRNRYSRKA